MVGRKTQEQQKRVLQGRENAANADKDFNAEADLHRSDALRKAQRQGQDLSTEHADSHEEDDRSILRGKNQESRHHKGAGD
ncbi:hypothetical protein GOD61_11700 [Sinorhizobium medicae]|nr:hypothetical protein [Sinorhizobium medicae]